MYNISEINFLLQFRVFKGSLHSSSQKSDLIPSYAPW